METPHEIAEHVCGTLLEKARCMLSNFGLSMDFWAEFVELEIQALGAFIQLCQDMLGFPVPVCKFKHCLDLIDICNLCVARKGFGEDERRTFPL
ncbi:unnamed protein product [Prunus armeniaca]